jgi:hypothetical protein
MYALKKFMFDTGMAKLPEHIYKQVPDTFVFILFSYITKNWLSGY